MGHIDEMLVNKVGVQTIDLDGQLKEKAVQAAGDEAVTVAAGTRYLTAVQMLLPQEL